MLSLLAQLMGTGFGEKNLKVFSSLMWNGHQMEKNIIFGISNGEVQIFDNTGNFCVSITHPPTNLYVTGFRISCLYFYLHLLLVSVHVFLNLY